MEESTNKPKRKERYFFIAPEEIVDWLESDEYKAAMRQTYETRARVGGITGRFLMNTKAGQYLLRTLLFTHPIIREQEKQEEKIKRRAEQLETIVHHLDKNAAELMARIEPDFQPRDSLQVILESRIDNLAFIKRISKDEYDPNCDIDHAFKITLTEILSGLGPFPQEQLSTLNDRFPDILLDRKINYILDRFYQLLADRDWAGFLELVLSYHNNSEVLVEMACWICDHSQYIFPNRHFRAALFKKLMTILIQEGEHAFRRFDKLWLDVGLDMSDELEKQQLAKTVFPLDLWYKLMNENPRRYLELQELLRIYGICP